jgi:hypothetical protein
MLWLTNKKIQLPDIEARLLIVVARQLKQRKPVLIGRKPAAFRLVQVDKQPSTMSLRVKVCRA